MGIGEYEKKKTINQVNEESLKMVTRGSTTTSIENSWDLLTTAEQLPLENMSQRVALLTGQFDTWYRMRKENTPNKKSIFNQERYKFFLEAPFEICNQCCNIMKKSPSHTYCKQTGTKFITAQMAVESRLRIQQWLNHGCNGFDLKNPISNPMSFWTEQDVLLYVRLNKTKIATVYGEVLTDDEINGQTNIWNLLNMDETELFELNRPVLSTTGCNRTGCVFCGFGCHLEKRPNRFEMIDMVSNESIRDFCMRGGSFDDDGLWKPDNRGLGMWFVLKWIDVHGKFNIYIPEYERYEREYGNDRTRKFLCLKG